MKWTEVRVDTVSKNEDVVSAVLYDMGATGLVVEDPNDILEKIQDPKSDYIVADEFFKNPEEVDKEKIVIKAYFPETENVGEIVNEISSRIEVTPLNETGKALGEVTLGEVSEDDWANSWKKFFKPTKIGSKIVIKPTWEEYDLQQGEIIVEMDPGMAFGTGTHETTAMCIEMLEKHVKCGTTVLDVGCGSGILSIAAIKLGAGQGAGIDIDENAIRISRENAKINDVAHRIEFRHGKIDEVVYEEYHIVVANILADVIVDMVPEIKRCMKCYGTFIASGIIQEKEEMVTKALEEVGLNIVEVIRRGEWVCLVAQFDGQKYV